MPRSNFFSYPISDIKYDFMASIVVFLVAIPLCLGIALASGAPLYSGLIAGIIGGIVVGIISQSSISVSGPAAGMAAVVLTSISQLGSFNAFLLALFFAGIIQIIIGTIRAGFVADYIPSNVIQGLLCAIGILIIIKQLPFAFTYTSENNLLLDEFKDASQILNLQPLSNITDHINIGAVFITAISFALLIFFDNTKNATLKAIPGPIIVVILGALINEFYAYFFPLIAQYSHELVNIPINKDINSFINQLQLPSWERWTDINIYVYAFILAAVASLEALLNLEAVEKLDQNRKYCSRNRELIAQGVGNIASGIVGGLPITSVVVRSSVNIQAGSKSKISAIFHGIWILLVVCFIPHWINLIPLASLATILIYVGFKLTKPAIYKEMYAQGFAQFFPFLVTIIAIIFTNLLTGILIGLFISFFFILKNNSQIHLDILNEKHPRGEIKHIVLPQHLSFLSKASLVNELESIPSGTQLIVDARYTKYIDKDIQEVLNVFMHNQAPSKNIALNMLGFKDHYQIKHRRDFINVTTYDTQLALKPADVLEILKEGNKRFSNDQRINRSLLDEIKATSGTQHPLAIVIGCIDSRVPIETIFDMGVGDIFVARIAGNVIDDDILASIEFACHVSGAKLIVVLGHTMCGAIRAACKSDGGGGHLGALLNKIKHAVTLAKQVTKDTDMESKAFLKKVTHLNIQHSMSSIHKRSVILNKLAEEKQIELIGALYDVSSGMVDFDEKFFTE